MSEGTLLAVDDDPDNLRVLSGILQRAGYAVRVANGGVRALKLIERQAPDLVLLDVHMPEMDGYELCRLMQERPGLSGVPVIFLSALDDVTAKLRGFAAGAVDYVTKPFQEAEVLARVATQLRVSRLRSELEGRNRALATLNEALGREKELTARANRAKDVFLASMSHELRTPLNAILGFAQLMERRPGRDAEDLESLGIIGRSGEHLLELINDVLSLSKIEAGHQALRVAPFDLSSRLRSCVEMLRARAEARGLQLRYEPAGLPAGVLGDEGKLGQIVLNLLGNAVKFTGLPGGPGTVTLRARWAEGRAVLEVEDTGPGLSPDDVSRLFRPFEQTETGVRSGEGTGLGLAVSRGLARLMGGDITVESAPGRGARFRVEAELPPADAAWDPQARDRRRVRRLVPGEASPRILVVDDVVENRTLISRLLSGVGFEVREAADGEEAVEGWRRYRPALIFMDRRLPRVDGLEATRRIRAEERDSGRARTAIVALSASALEHERAELLEAGCDAFVSKPFREETLFDVLAERLGVRYEHDGVPEPAADASDGRAIDPGRVARLPAPLRDALADAFERGDLDGAEAAVDRVAPLDEELAAALRAAVSDFRFEVALGALRRGAG